MSLRSNERAEIRHKSFKASVGADDGRRRRVDTTVAISKRDRDRCINEKRQRFSGDAAAPSSASEMKFDSLVALVQAVYSEDSNLQLEAITQFRKMLSNARDPPIEAVVNTGVVPRFMQLLTREDCPELQFEAAWAFTNIASGTSENTRVVVDHGAVPIFVKLLSSPNENIRDQAVWALGNIAGDSTKYRDLVLANGALFPLVRQLTEHDKLPMLRNAVWALSNFCRGKPPPNFDHVKTALPALQQLIQCEDEQVITDCCWALSYLTDSKVDRIQAVIEAGVCPRLVHLLTHPSPSVLTPALRAVGNIVTGNDVQTQCILDNLAIPCLGNLLAPYQKRSIKKEACWTISNITAGTRDQIQAVINANIIGPLVHLLQTAEFDIKQEAAWAISNATSNGTHDQIKYLVSQGCIKALCDLLGHSGSKVVMVCLEALENILKVGEVEKNSTASGVNMYAEMIDEAEGTDKIEELQNHDSAEIYNMAVRLLESYWEQEEDVGTPSSVLPPVRIPEGEQSVPSGGFNFG